MLWSLVKALIFVALVVAVAFGAGALLETSGGITIQMGGVEANLSVIQTVIGLVLLVAVVWLVIKLVGLLVATLRFINGDETAISRYFSRNRERRGYEALSQGLMALASGEGKTAMAQAAKAERYLNKPELTNLVTAQAAEMTGDRTKAEEVYKTLLKDDSTRFVGVRGLLKQKLADGDNETSKKLAEKAFSLKPKHVETQDTLLKLQAGDQDWNGARRTLAAKLKHGVLPRDVHRRRDAVMALSEARSLRSQGKIEEAQALSIEADRLSPELIPAAVMAAKAYIEQESPRYATRVIKAAWDKQPHPELAAAYAAIAPDEDSAARVKRFKTLVRSTPKDPESRMTMAELYISTEDFAEARKALGDLPVADPTVRSLTIMAAIERGEGAEDRVVRGWLTKALSAPRDASWICDSCGHIHETWDPVCDNCEAVDTLSWKRPPATADMGTAPMLPLIVGAPETVALDTAPATDPAEVLTIADEPEPAADVEVITPDITNDVSVPDGATRH